MPIAGRADSAHTWATHRLVELWVCYADGLDDATAEALAAGLEAVRSDGARVALVTGASGQRDVRVPSDWGAWEPSGRFVDMLAPVADLVLDGPSPPSPRAVAEAAQRLGPDDMRRVGVIGATTSAIEAGHCAGSAVVVGIVSDGGTRQTLLAGQPDVIVTPATFATEDARRWASRRAHRQRVLLNPGPTVVSDRVHRAVAGPDLCHREPEYATLAARLEERLLLVSGAPADWRAVLLAGSGTSAMEAMVVASVRPGRRLLVVRNGSYGDRLALMAERHGIGRVEVDGDHRRPIDPDRVAAALDADPAIDAVAVVQHETTTGLLNPVAEIAAVARARQRLVAVDAISALGAEELPLVASGIDFVAGTANKCLQGLPGIAFVLLSPEAQERVRDGRPDTVYLDMATYLAAADRGAPPFTPSIPAAYGLDAALEELLDEGVEARRARYRQRMAFLDASLDELGLEPVVAVPYRSATVRAYELPQGHTYAELHDRLKEVGYVIYAGQGSSAASQFRVCVLGEIGIDALADFRARLGDILA